MFSNVRTINKITLEAEGLNNIVSINSDLVVIDPKETKGNVIMMSLIDAPAKLDKIRADYNKSILGNMSIYGINENDEKVVLIPYYAYSNSLNFQGLRLNFIKNKIGDLSHLLISQNSDSSYIIRFSKETSLIELVMNKLINTYFIPCNEKLVQETLNSDKDILSEMIVITSNEQLKEIEVYKFDKNLFVEVLNSIAKMKGEKPDPIFENFVGDFTGYINYFKPDILMNLDSKIEQFYDPDNVPSYVTEFPYPLPNEDMRKILDKISVKYFNKDLFSLEYGEQKKVYETYKYLDAQGKIIRSKGFNPQWSKQYVCWSAAMKILEEEKFCYMSLVMGSGKTISSLKANRYTCTNTLKRKNFITFILCPQSTITQWIGEIDLIEKGIGNTKDDYDIIIIDKTKKLMDFYYQNSIRYEDSIRFDNSKIKKPTYILCGKEAFKLSQVKRPAIQVRLDKEGKPLLFCPNCGRLLITKKKDKYGRIMEIPMRLEDFFNNNGKKTIKSSNIHCERCEEDLLTMKEIRELTSEEDKLELINSLNNFKTSDYNLWTLDYLDKNDIRNKIYNKLSSPDNWINPKSESIKEKLKNRKEQLENYIGSLELLHNVDKSYSKKISVIDFIKSRKFEFDTVIIDEAHEGNNSKSLIGTAQRLLFKYSKKVILLSGTANNGYASSLHNLLMASMPYKLIEDGTFDKKDFVRKYGILEGVIKVDEKGKVSGKSDLSASNFKEVEGINPVVFTKFLARNFIMVNTLQELDLPMPKLTEKYVRIEQEDEIISSYNYLISAVDKENIFASKMFTASVYKNYLNNPYSWNPLEVSVIGGTVEVEVPCVDRNKFQYLPKDYELLDIVKKEKEEGRKCFIFTDFVEGGKYIKPELLENRPKECKITINDRICQLLKENGIKYLVLESNTTSVANRKNYIENKKDDVDVFICQPQLVNVGLNLVFCPTYIVYTPFYRYDIISQATRRGYRANSTEENRIFHLYYSNTCEEKIINRYQRKLAEAKAIEGEFYVNIEEGKDLRTLSKMSNDIVKN